MGERYLEGLALWQAEDVPPYRKPLGRRAVEGGTRPFFIRPFFVRPFFGRAGRPWPAEGSPSDRSRAIHAKNEKRHKCQPSKLWGGDM